MKIYVCVYVCVLLVSMHSFPTSWFLPSEEGEVLKSHTKNKRSCHFYFTQKKIRKCPKSQEGTCPTEIRALLLQRYDSVPLGICIFQRVFK